MPRDRSNRMSFSLPVAIGKRLRAHAHALGIGIGEAMEGLIHAHTAPLEVLERGNAARDALVEKYVNRPPSPRKQAQEMRRKLDEQVARGQAERERQEAKEGATPRAQMVDLVCDYLECRKPFQRPKSRSGNSGLVFCSPRCSTLHGFALGRVRRKENIKAAKRARSPVTDIARDRGRKSAEVRDAARCGPVDGADVEQPTREPRKPEPGELVRGELARNPTVML